MSTQGQSSHLQSTWCVEMVPVCVLIQVRVSRDGRDGTLEVDDGFETFPLSTQGQSHTVEVNAPYYVGGMPTDVADNAAHNLQV